jgi:uncharacterized protein YbdZ (MbtH family)
MTLTGFGRFDLAYFRHTDQWFTVYRGAGSVVSNSITSTTCSFVTSFTKRPWYVSVWAVVLPVPVGWSYVSEILKGAPFASLELVNVAGHTRRHLPRCDRLRIKNFFTNFR